MPSGIHTLADLRAKASASNKAMGAPPTASSATKDSSIISPPTAPTQSRASMMSGASGLILAGGTFTNVGGAVYRKMPADITATSLPEAPLEESESETIVAEALDNISNLTATAGVEVDNFGTELLAGQRPKKQNIHVCLLEKVKDSEIKGGKFTNAATVVYVDEVIAKEKV